MVDELAAAITDGDPSPGRLDRAAVELYHVPKLADAAVVDYDARESIVRYRSCAPVSRLLQLAAEPPE